MSNLDKREKVVYAFLHNAKEVLTSLDDIIEGTKYKPEQVLSTLLILEVRRKVRQFPGKRFGTKERTQPLIDQQRESN